MHPAAELAVRLTRDGCIGQMVRAGHPGGLSPPYAVDATAVARHPVPRAPEWDVVVWRLGPIGATRHAADLSAIELRQSRSFEEQLDYDFGARSGSGSD